MQVRNEGAAAVHVVVELYALNASVVFREPMDVGPQATARASHALPNAGTYELAAYLGNSTRPIVREPVTVGPGLPEIVVDVRDRGASLTYGWTS